MAEFIYECALCFIFGDAEVMERREVKFAWDLANNTEKPVCKDRVACNARRMARLNGQTRVKVT